MQKRRNRVLHKSMESRFDSTKFGAAPRNDKSETSRRRPEIHHNCGGKKRIGRRQSSVGLYYEFAVNTYFDLDLVSDFWARGCC